MARSLALSILPWAGAVVVVGVAGAALGVSGLVGRPHVHKTVVTVSAAVAFEVDAASCPGGAIVSQLQPGTRVLAIARSADSSSLGVRDPSYLSHTIWVRANDVVLDIGQPQVSTLAVGACPVITVGVASSLPQSTPTPTSTNTAPTQHDSTAPTITAASANPTSIYQHGFTPEKSVISASALDNVGVTRITATWPTVGPIAAGSAQINGGSGSFTFGPFSIAPSDAGSYDIPITLVAHDAAGNASAPHTITVTIEFNYG